MHKRNAVQLRSALSAAAICAVLAVATFSGVHRAGSAAIRTVRETEPIVVRSISTIREPGGKKHWPGSSHDRLPSPLMTNDERLALMTQTPRRFRVDALKGE